MGIKSAIAEERMMFEAAMETLPSNHTEETPQEIRARIRKIFDKSILSLFAKFQGERYLKGGK